MSILDAAKEAWAQARGKRESDARTAVGVVLAPFDVSKLEAVDVQVTDAHTRVVFRDPTDGIHLAARTQDKGWTVHLVTNSNGWTTQGKPVESLAHLYEIVAKQSPEVTT